RYTGSPDIGPRIGYTGATTYPKDQYQWLTASLVLPSVGSKGFDSARYTVRNPGDENFDISVLKNIPLHREGMRLQLRLEMFNALNHTRFNGFNNTANLSTAGQITNLPSALGGGGGRFGFGALTGTNSPRNIQ